MFWLWPWFWLGQMQALIRPAIPADCARMAVLHAENFAAGWDRSDIEQMLFEGHTADVLVSRAPIGDVVTGFAISRVVLDEAELLTIALDEEVRGRGLSTGLLTRHAERLRRAGAARIFLEVAAGNDPALALYRKAGFIEIGRRKGYYPGTDGMKSPRRDALAMCWDIGHLDPTPRAW
jgi:[ribosomal protein S18]-alanine N-acetyltransferase